MSNTEAVDQRGGRWRNDAPPLCEVVEVWYINRIVLAAWSGVGWSTVDGSPLPSVVYWRVHR